LVNRSLLNRKTRKSRLKKFDNMTAHIEREKRGGERKNGPEKKGEKKEGRGKIRANEEVLANSFAQLHRKKNHL